MARALLSSLLDELSALLAPVAAALDSPEAMAQLLDRLGVVDDEAATSLSERLAALLALKTSLEALARDPAPDPETVRAALDLTEAAFSALRTLDVDRLPGAEIEGFGRDLVHFLLQCWMAKHHPIARDVGALLTLVDIAQPQPAQVRGQTLLRRPFASDRLRLDRLPALLRDPRAALEAAYANPMANDADAEALATRLFLPLARLLRNLGVSCRTGYVPGDEALLGDAAPLMRFAMIVYAIDPLLNGEEEAGVVLSLSPAGRGDLGLVVTPFGALTLRTRLGDWDLASTVAGDIQAFAWGRHGLTLLGSAADSTLSVDLSAETRPSASGPAYRFGAADGSRIEIGRLRLAAALSLSSSTPSLAVAADADDAVLVLAPGDRDGFLAELLPADGLRADLSLGIAWSNAQGLRLRGSGGLDATLPASLSFGGVRLSALHVAIGPAQEHVTAEVSASFSAQIGPVVASVDRVGFEAALAFPPGGGNLGPVDLGLGAKPPTGVGLAVSAGGLLAGGGALFHDPVRALYAGTLQLSLAERITLKAFGLIATRMPDGRRGYSLTVFMTAEDFRPIPLGMGFNLLGIGGMLGVHRRFDVEAMRTGLAAGTLGLLLFPADPVRDAAAVVRAVDTVFPASRGNHLFGVLAKIGWMSPPLVTLDLALIQQFGQRRQLVALGRIQSLLPTRDDALIRLNLDVMGVFDFDEGRVEIDGVLVDSRLAYRFAMTGGAALRARLGGAGRGFVLAMGGFNPRFVPPAGVPTLQRLAIALSAGDNPRLTCEAYFAITSNTVQFGARAQLYAAALGFSIAGEVGFDVLLRMVPLQFVADFRASVQLRRGSHNLFKVSVAGTLEGPRPLRVSGKASFEILWCDFSVRFDRTLVDGQRPPLPPAIDLRAELVRALADPAHWTMERDAAAHHGVALRRLPAGAGNGVLDPLGALTVRQQAVPLDTPRDITLFGGAPAGGARRRFHLEASLDGVAGVAQAVTAPFAPAQYFELGDEERLAGPSFEEMNAGLRFGGDAWRFDAAAGAASTLIFDTIVFDDEGGAAPPAHAQPAFVLQAAALEHQLAAGAGARMQREDAPTRFRQTGAASLARVQTPRWVIASVDDIAVSPPSAPAAGGWTAQRAALAALAEAGDTRWQLLHAHER